MSSYAIKYKYIQFPGKICTTGRQNPKIVRGIIYFLARGTVIKIKKIGTFVKVFPNCAANTRTEIILTELS